MDSLSQSAPYSYQQADQQSAPYSYQQAAPYGYQQADQQSAPYSYQQADIPKKSTFWAQVKTGFIIAAIIIALWWLYCIIIYRGSQTRLDNYALSAYKKYNSYNQIADSLSITSLKFQGGVYYITLTNIVKGASTTFELQLESSTIGAPPLRTKVLKNPIQTFITEHIDSKINIQIDDLYIPPEEDNVTYWEAVNSTVNGTKLQTTIFLTDAITQQRLVYCNASYELVGSCTSKDTNCIEL